MHLAVIPDGNRRWAESNGLDHHQGHHQGADTFYSLIDVLSRSELVDECTLFAFSSENVSRSVIERSSISFLFSEFILMLRFELLACAKSLFSRSSENMSTTDFRLEDPRILVTTSDK